MIWVLYKNETILASHFKICNRYIFAGNNPALVIDGDCSTLFIEGNIDTLKELLYEINTAIMNGRKYIEI